MVYPQQDPSDDLTQTMHGYGWTVWIIKVPKKLWISNDDQVEFDNEEDCHAYHNKQSQREEEKEDKLWLEARRRDPFWRNDSDYD